MGRKNLFFCFMSFPNYFRIIHLVSLQKLSKKLTFLTFWYAQVGVRVSRVRNDSFSENFAKVLNEWTPLILPLQNKIFIIHVTAEGVASWNGKLGKRES